MKTLFVKKLTNVKNDDLAEAGNTLEEQTIAHPIGVVNWENFPYKPNVSFRIGHDNNKIWLKFYVKEKHIRALETKTNGDVYKDSCVEFFISFDGKNYFNFEFNCIGTVHLAYGPGRENRQFVAPEIIDRMEIFSTLGTEPFEEKSGNFEWEMLVKIPMECFVFDKPDSLTDLKATANFYKCGDETSEPHYITWNPIKTDAPDYHQPNFFGKIWFE